MGVILEVQLLHLQHQPAAVLAAQLVIAAENPVVAQHVLHQIIAAGEEHLLVAAAGVETGQGVLVAGQQGTAGPQVVDQAVLRQAAGLLHQGAVQHAGQRLAAQFAAGITDQARIQCVGTERLFQQATEVRVQAGLHGRIAGEALGPVLGHPFLQPLTVTAPRHAEHQVGAQVVEQLFTVMQAGLNPGFQAQRHILQQQLLQLVPVGAVQCRIHRFALIEPGPLAPAGIGAADIDPAGGVAAVQNPQHALGVFPGLQALLILLELLGDAAQLLEPLVVGRKTVGPGQPGDYQAGGGGSEHQALAPVDAFHLALIQPGELRLGEDHPAEQVTDEARAAAAGRGYRRAARPQVAADAGGERVETAAHARRAGQVEAAQLGGALVAVAGEGQLDQQAQGFAQAAQLMRKIEDAPAAADVPLLMQAHDHLAVETLQQVLELLAHDLQVGAILVLAEAHAQYLIILVAGQVVEVLVEAEQQVGLAQNQIDRHLHAEPAVDFQQPLADLPRLVFQRLLVLAQQQIDRQVDQHAIERTLSAVAQQPQQGIPAKAVNLGIGLAEIASAAVDQYRMFGEVPVGITGTGDLVGDTLLITGIEREIQPGELQQAGLAAALGAEQQVPGQLPAPAFTATLVQARTAEGTQGLLVAAVQLELFLDDQVLPAQALLGFAVAFLGLQSALLLPVGEHQTQTPAQQQGTDGQPAGAGAAPGLVIIDGQGRAQGPDNHRQAQHQDQAPGPALADHAQCFEEYGFGIHCRSSLKVVSASEAGLPCMNS